MISNLLAGLYQNEIELYNLFLRNGEHTTEEKEAFIKNLILGRELAQKDPSLIELRKQQNAKGV